MADNRNRNRIYDQIESSADYYDPSIYARLLTFYDSLSLHDDKMSGQFVPVSPVSISGRNTKLFAIGLLPPTHRRVSRTLDRSASVADELGRTLSVFDESPENAAPVTDASKTSVPMGPTDDKGEFWERYVKMCNRLGVDAHEMAKVLYSESGFKGSAVAMRGDPPHPVAKGLNQLILKTALGLGMSEETWNNLENVPREEQLQWVEKYFKNRGVRGRSAAEIYVTNFGGYRNPDGSMYHGNAAALGYPDAKRQQQAYEQNKLFDKDKKGYITPEDLARTVAKPLNGRVAAAINKAKRSVGMSTEDTGSVPSDATSQWDKSASQSAQTGRKGIEKTTSNSMKGALLGRALTDAQEQYAKELHLAIDRIAQTPPLRFLVNPQSFKVGEEKIIADGSWGRKGPITEHWGDQQSTIEGSGKLAAFYSIDAATGQGGLTRTGRQFSESYQNFLSLYLLYRNNGGVWLNEYRNGGLTMVGSVYLYYDHTLYIGSFKSFNVNETDTAPFTLEYSFSFAVRAAYLLDYVDDPKFTYGAPELLQAPKATSVSTTSAPIESGEEREARLLAERQRNEKVAQQLAASDDPSSSASHEQARIDAVVQSGTQGAPSTGQNGT